jgi:hypothetical protein
VTDKVVSTPTFTVKARLAGFASGARRITLTTNPTPWKVYAAKLRPQFAARIVEIQDADGSTVVAWSGFDWSESC